MIFLPPAATSGCFIPFASLFSQYGGGGGGGGGNSNQRKHHSKSLFSFFFRLLQGPMVYRTISKIITSDLPILKLCDGLTSVTWAESTCTLDSLNAIIRTASTRGASGSAAFHGSLPRYSLSL